MLKKMGTTGTFTYTETAKKVAALVSGGMDSATLLYYLKDRGYDVHAISVDYGQRHGKELDYAAYLTESLGVRWTLLDISPVVKGLLDASALTGDVEIPEGHYAQETMKQTVVPNRNMFMLALAGAVAANNRYAAIAAAVHAGDHAIYPDCRPQFMNAMRLALGYAVPEETYEGLQGASLELITPFLYMSKQEIAETGFKLGVSWADTWSCYKGEETHCGRCGTCVERAEAINLAAAKLNKHRGVGQFHDPTPYQDALYWKTATGQDDCDC